MAKAKFIVPANNVQSVTIPVNDKGDIRHRIVKQIIGKYIGTAHISISKKGVVSFIGSADTAAAMQAEIDKHITIFDGILNRVFLRYCDNNDLYPPTDTALTVIPRALLLYTGNSN